MPTVRLFGGLRREANIRQMGVPGRTIREVLSALCGDKPGLRAALLDGDQLRPYVRVMVNGRDIELAQGLETVLASEDQVAIFPPIVGGGAKSERERTGDAGLGR